GGARQSGSVTFVGAKLLGTPVVLTPAGLAVGDTTAPFPASTPIDSLLAQTGLSVRMLPDSEAAAADGTESRRTIGGVEIRFDRPEREFGVGFVLGRLSVSARAVRPEDTPVDVPVAVPAVPDPGLRDPLAVEAPPAVFVAEPLPAPETVVSVVFRRISEPARPVASPAEVAAPPSPAAPAATLPAAAGAVTRAAPVRTGDWSGIAGLLVLAGPAAVLLRRLLRVATAL
ncbi:MAG TPA: hypothetical protein VFS16_04040, partial [Acidimicrobiia bacterium]|nr:hypothetical protein [Acidimicrobiia bacterium]